MSEGDPSCVGPTEERRPEIVEDSTGPDPTVPVGPTREVELESGYSGVEAPIGEVLAASETIDTDERVVEFGK